VWQLNLTENHRDGRPASLRQTRGGRSGWPVCLLHHARGHDPFNAAVEFKPVMSPDDLAKAQPGIDRAVKTYG
jgi:hypothetical protein